MSSDNSDAIVLTDQDGRYYVIPREIMQEALVPDSAKGAVDADISEVDGFSMPGSHFSVVGGISLSTPRIKTNYGFRKTGWPCDFPAGGWPCDTPQLGGSQSH